MTRISYIDYADRMNLGCDALIHKLKVARADLDEFDRNIQRQNTRILNAKKIQDDTKILVDIGYLMAELDALMKMRPRLADEVLHIEHEISKQIISAVHLICI
jgi:hypothetical protein